MSNASQLMALIGEEMAPKSSTMLTGEEKSIEKEH